MGAVTLREIFMYLTDTSATKRVGPQAWLAILIVVTEVLIVVKFDWPLVTMPAPANVKLFLAVSGAAWLVWTIYAYYVHRYWSWSKYRAKFIRLQKALSRRPTEPYTNGVNGNAPESDKKSCHID
jgi:hypothetical protein